MLAWNDVGQGESDYGCREGELEMGRKGDGEIYSVRIRIMEFVI